MGKVQSVPLGVQTDPGLILAVAGQPKSAPPVFRTGQVIRSLVQDRPEMRLLSNWGKHVHLHPVIDIILVCCRHRLGIDTFAHAPLECLHDKE